MKKLSLFLFALLTLFACSTEKAKEGESPQTEAQAAAPQRVITIGGTVTETVAALGFGSQIIAVDRTSTFPEFVHGLENVGYRNQIKAEGILSLKADVVYAQEGSLSEEVLAQLKEAKQKLVLLPETKNLAQTEALITKLGESLKAKDKATVLIETLKSEIKRTAEKVEKLTEKPRVLFVYARGQGTVNAAGQGTFAQEILPLAGCEAILQPQEGFKPLTAEALVAENPDYILFFDSGLNSLGGIEGALKIPGITQTTAGKKKQILSIDGLLLSGFGPRAGQAIATLFEQTHPESLPQ
jgi:iron complex transport system substrate-binding protein